MFYVGLLEIFGNLLLVTILWRAFAEKMFLTYKVFYVYICLALAFSISQLLVKRAYGVGSDPYYYVYHISNLVLAGVLAWVFLNIYLKIVGNSKTSWSKMLIPAMLVALVAAMAWFKVLTVPGGDPFHRCQTVILPALVITGLIVFWSIGSSCSPMMLGRNLSGILFGISLIVGLQAINHVNLVFLDESFKVFKFSVQFCYFVPSAVLCYSLWEYRPFLREQDYSRVPIGEIDEKLQKVVKALLLNK